MNYESPRKFLQNYSWLIFALLLTTGVIQTFNKSNGSTNLYAYQAEAFLHGDFAIQEKPNKLPDNTQRFSLDFLPVLILLIALGFRNSSEDLRAYWKGMIVYAILLNVLTNFLPAV